MHAENFELRICVCISLIFKLIRRTGGEGCNFSIHRSLLPAYSKAVTEEQVKIMVEKGKCIKLKNKTVLSSRTVCFITWHWIVSGKVKKHWD